MKKTLFIKNAAILTVTSFILRFLGIFLKVWLAARIGSEGIGLYHLIFSFYVFISAFSQSGIPVATTRLVCSAYAKNQGGINGIIAKACSIALTFALVTFTLSFFGAPFIAGRILGDIRAADGIRMICFALPFIGISAVIKGYFIAVRKVSVNSFSQIFEQAVRIFLCLYLVDKFMHLGIAAATAAVMAGDAISEIVSCVYLLIMYKIKSSENHLSNECEQNHTKELLRISTPITLGRYFTSALRTGENILVPKMLSASGMEFSDALSTFGAIKGMALPLLFFPSSLLQALSSLLLPEMSEAVATNRAYVIKNAVNKTLRTTWLTGVIFGTVFFFGGTAAGIIVYHDSYCGTLVKYLAPLVPFMYCDSVCDGILKGLDKQKFTFYTAVADSSVRLLLIISLLPFLSLNGFLAIMYLSNFFTCFLHVGKLLKITGLKIKLLKDILMPFAGAAVITFFCFRIFAFLPTQLTRFAVSSMISVALYLGYILLFKIADIKDYL